MSNTRSKRRTDGRPHAGNARRIITTLVMRGDAYVPGAVALATSLRPYAADCGVELWCMCTHDVSADARKTLAMFFNTVVTVPYIEHKTRPMRSQKQQQIYGDWIDQSFTKWNIFDNEVFPIGSLVMFMDADMIVRRSQVTDASDFIRDTFGVIDAHTDGAATFSSPWVAPYADTTMRSPYAYRHGDPVQLDDVRTGLSSSIVAVASLVIVRPQIFLYQRVLRILRQCRGAYGHACCVSGHDEQLLAEVILRGRLRFRHIHPRYNWLVGKDAWLEGERALTLHYYGVKPWQRVPEWPDEREWWRVASDAARKIGDADTVSRVFPLLAEVDADGTA